MKKDCLYIVMPAYNEEKNIASVVEAWYPLLSRASEDSRLVVADSGSTDRTSEILKKLCETHPQLEILTKSGQQHGPKLMALYHHAIESGADLIFQTDSDGQTDPADFDAFWKRRRRYDAILGYRPRRGDGPVRKFVERVLCFLLWLFFGVKLPDANAPYRLMRASLVKKYLERLPMDYNIPNVMFSVYFAHYHEKLRFLPVSFRARQGGKNSVDITKIVHIGWKALGEFYRLKKEM
ncbi:MAG: glycosyltransferase family 2 protein [Lachnospiraceae bacterium]|nr:glycosyltransferase family 2 protein [Lachnospiraceae bacterium]